MHCDHWESFRCLLREGPDLADYPGLPRQLGGGLCWPFLPLLGLLARGLAGFEQVLRRLFTLLLLRVLLLVLGGLRLALLLLVALDYYASVDLRDNSQLAARGVEQHELVAPVEVDFSSPELSSHCGIGNDRAN